VYDLNVDPILTTKSLIKQNACDNASITCIIAIILDDMNFRELAEKVRFYKEDEKGVAEMCKVMEDMRNETAKKIKIEAIISIMEKLKYTAEQAMDLLNIPQAERATYVGLVEKR
jgi:hypothetical protein